MLAYMFVQYSTHKFDNGATRADVDPWTLTAFRPRNEPYYDTISSLQENLKDDIEFSW